MSCDTVYWIAAGIAGAPWLLLIAKEVWLSVDWVGPKTTVCLTGLGGLIGLAATASGCY